MGSIPPDWGGRRPGGVATTHAALIESWNEGLRLEVAGVIPLNPGPSLIAPVQMHPREARTPVAEHYASVLQATQPDVVVFHHVAHEWAAAHSALMPRVAACGIIHSWTPLRGERRYSVDRLRETIQGLDLLVFPSSFARREGLALGVAPYGCATAVIPNPIRSGPPVALDGIRSGVVFVGTLTANKNVGGLLEGLAAAGYVERITVIGEGPTEGALSALTSRLSIQKQVTFEGRMDPAGVLQQVAAASVFCLPSFSESFGIAAIEALSVGTPVAVVDPPYSEIAAEISIPIGAPISHPFPGEIAESVMSVESENWDHHHLAAAARNVFSAGRIAAIYGEALESVLV